MGGRITLIVPTAVGLLGVPRQVDGATSLREVLLERQQVVVKMTPDPGLDLLAGGPQILPVLELADHPEALVADRARCMTQVRALLAVVQRRFGRYLEPR